MSRVLLTAVALMLFAASIGAQRSVAPPPRSVDPRSVDPMMSRALAHLASSEYVEALSAFDKALDSYATAQRLDEVRHTYMQMFVGNRNYANVLMKAMKAWVAKQRTASAGASASALAEFSAWVQERDALAAATVNLAHNSPDWK